MIGDLVITAIIAGAGIWATRLWQQRMDERARDDVQQYYDRKKAEQRVSMRDA